MSIGEYKRRIAPIVAEQVPMDEHSALDMAKRWGVGFQSGPYGYSIGGALRGQYLVRNGSESALQVMDSYEFNNEFESAE